MIAIDTNILVHAHREDSPWHEAATAAMGRLGGRIWAIPWPCIHEFLAIATHPKIFAPPSPLRDAVEAVKSWAASTSITFLAELDGYAEVLAEVLLGAKVTGPRIHDARIVALCRQHAVDELWSADRDFSRFPSLVVRNPLLS